MNISSVTVVEKTNVTATSKVKLKYISDKHKRFKKGEGNKAVSVFEAWHTLLGFL